MRLRHLAASLLVGGTVAWGMALAPLSGPRAMLPALADGGTSLYFSSDGRRLITVHENNDEGPDEMPLGSAGLWDAATGRCLAVLANSEPYVFSVTFAPDGRFCAGAMADGSVHVWDANTGSLIREASNKWLKIADPDTQIVWAPDNRLLFGLPVASARCAMHDVETDQHVHTVPLWKCSTTTWRFQEFAVGASPGRVLVARLATGEETAAFDVADYEPVRDPFREPFRDMVLALAPDGRAALVGGKTTGLRLLNDAGVARITLVGSDDSDMLTRALFFENPPVVWGKPGPFRRRPSACSPALSANGKLLAYHALVFLREWLFVGERTLTNYLRVMDTATGREVAAIPNVYCGAFAPDDRTLAVIVDGGVQLWDMPPRRSWTRIVIASAAAAVVVYCFLIRRRLRSNVQRA